MSHSSEDGIRPALVDRKFLSSNATSHEWMFGAIAELIDNACDPDVNANQFWIDVEEINGETCLTFTDNGNGMNTEVLHRMLSFGFSNKQECNGRLPIGRYGNGFKSGSMRLGRDTLVFTCQETMMSCGMLSQTYLEKIDSKTVLVPIVTWDVQTNIIYPLNKKSSLDDILKYSLFFNEKDLLKQIESIPCMRRKRDEKGNLELDFSSSESDIRLSAVNETESENRSSKSVSLYRTSLKKYISILYMKPPMQVFLRKKKVKTICIKKILTHQKKFTYVPKGVTMIHAIKIFFGINEDQDEYGMMMYHRNRLIQAFRKSSFPKKIHDNGEVSYQQVREILETVIGVVELDCLTPNHIKQNFQDDLKFRNIETNLKNKLWQYCLSTIEEIEEKKKSGENQEEKDIWVQCDNPDCQKWRRLPFLTEEKDLPEKWFCEMNPDKYYNKCSDPEEPEEEPEIPRLPYGKKGRRSTNSISEHSSPVHTSEAVNGTITKFLIPLNKDSGNSGALESIRENLQEASSVNDTISSPTDDPDEIPQLTPQLKRIANECLKKESSVRRKRLFPNSSNDVDEHNASKKSTSNPSDDFNKDIEEISLLQIEKTEPELIVIDDDDDDDNADLDNDYNGNNTKKLVNEKSENHSLYKKLKSELRSSPVVKQEKNTILATSDTLEAPDMFDSFLQTSPTDLEMSSLNENPMQDIGTSPVPFSLMFVEELRNKYEQEIADLQWQKTQLQMELQSTVEELEHERERANALETRLKYYERDQINSQDSDVIIVEEYS